jgi:hypothetical protein
MQKMYVDPPQFATICFSEIPLVSTLVAILLGATAEKGWELEPYFKVQVLPNTNRIRK